MDVSLLTTTVAEPLSRAQARCLRQFESGAMAGRRLAVIRSGTNSLSLLWADRPYTDWSIPQTIVTSAAEKAYDLTILNDTTAIVAYVDMTTADVMSVAITWAGTQFQVGTPVIAFTGDSNFDPSTVTDGSGTLWLSWTRLSSPPVRHIHIKASADGGATWGSGTTDGGDIVHSGGLIASSALAASPSRLYVVYYDDQQFLSVRSRAPEDAQWSAASIIASGAETSTVFSLAARPDGLLAMVYGVTELRYREFDGVNFNPVVTLHDAPVNAHTVWWQADSPVVLFANEAGSGQDFITYVDRRTGTFSAPALLDKHNDVFAGVLVYNAAAATFEDLTTASQTAATGDMYHSQSSALLERRGDALYVGLDLPFRLIHLLLSTPGSGGSLSYSYWDGARWIAFTPLSGATAFDQAETTIRLWSDYQAIPPDWQKVSIVAHSHFWIKVEALVDFTTAPLGTMANALGDIEVLNGGV